MTFCLVDIVGYIFIYKSWRTRGSGKASTSTRFCGPSDSRARLLGAVRCVSLVLAASIQPVGRSHVRVLVLGFRYVLPLSPVCFLGFSVLVLPPPLLVWSAGAIVPSSTRLLLPHAPPPPVSPASSSVFTSSGSRTRSSFCGLGPLRLLFLLQGPNYIRPSDFFWRRLSPLPSLASGRLLLAPVPLAGPSPSSWPRLP